MKRIFLVFLFVTVFTNILFAQTVKFSSDAPEIGKPLKFVYDPKGSNLDKLVAPITCTVKAISNRDARINIPVKLTKVGEVYEGEFTPRDSTNLAVLIFKADDTMDENPNGYFTKFYINGSPTPMGIFLEGHLYSGFGNNISKIKTDQKKAVKLYQVAFDLDAKLKEKYYSNFLQAQYVLDKVIGEKYVNETIALYNKLEPTEKTLTRIASFYTVIKNRNAADSMYRLIKTNYPKGIYAFNLALSYVNSISGGEEREKRLNILLNDFNLSLNNPADMAKVSRAFPGIGIGFLATKNYEKVEFYIDKVESKTTRAVLYNSFAMKDEIKNNLPFYEKISKKSIDLIESAMNDDEPAEYYNSKEEYMKVLNGNYIMFRGVYAGVLDQMGRHEEALTVIEDAVVRDNFSDIAMNTKYLGLLVKNNKNDKAVLYAERFIKEGKNSDDLKEILKSIYKGSMGFDDYYTGLNKNAVALQKEQIKSEMMNVIAPKFSLMNIDGKKVDLLSLKGKVVVVDYWATWCGPCISSFPAMQKAVDKYKNDTNVVFLFINTWQREENREKVVKDWMLANAKYKFNVLLDKESKDNPERFETVDKYKVKGIPTKFVVDGNGNIRFKKIGFSGSTEGTVKELDAMIELAKSASKPASK
jgi:thiol-disulfide isomerase/thioredoxin